MSAEDRRARTAVAALFLTNGALFANLLPRYPEIKADLSLSNSAYGVSIAAFSAGALLAGPSAAALIRRFRSSRVALAGTLLLAAFTLLAGLAPAPLLFAGALFVAGAADSVTDVAQNAHGLRVQRRYGRSIINSLHAVWSAGAVLGGLMGAAAIGLGIDRGVHLAASAVLFSAVCVVAYRFLLPGPDDQGSSEADHERVETVSPTTYLVLAALVGIGIAGAVIEDAGTSWATLYLRELGSPAALAVSGYVALVGAQFVGRLIGDRLVDRFGERTVARVGGVIVAVGMGVALAWPTVPTTILGFAAAGFGSATLVPAAMHGADRLPGLRRGTGLTVVTWLMRVGFLVAPPVVGVIADAAGLRVGLLSVCAAGVVAAILAAVLAGSRRSRA